MKDRFTPFINSVLAIVKFGVKSKECRRHGICEIKFTNKFDNLLKPFIGEAYAILKLNKDLVEICFLAASMDENTLRKHFCNNVFTLEESYQLDICIEHRTQTYWIPKGRYAISANEDQLIVKINCKNKEITNSFNSYIAFEEG